MFFAKNLVKIAPAGFISSSQRFCKINARFSLVTFGFLLLFALVASSGSASAVSAFPSSLTVLKAQSCNTETASTVINTFGGVCTGTYPAACPTDRISCNDATTVAPTVSGNNQYMGVRVSDYNSSISDCGGITNVKLCYEWWSSSASINTCQVSVDANNGGSYTNVSTTCPGIVANPGEICTDVTSFETWTCDNFFNTTGTRALATLQVKSSTGGAKTLSIDALYFNVTYTADASAPAVTIAYPQNTTYTAAVTTLNSTASDSNLQSCWYSLNGGTTNTSFTCNTNVTGLTSSSGVNTWKVWANDSFGNLNSSNVSFTLNYAPVIANASALPNPIAGSATLTIYANTSHNGVNDSEGNTLFLYCDDSTLPTSLNSECTSGTTNATYPYNLTCSFAAPSGSGSYTEYCRVYDGNSYSSAVQANYTVNATALTTSIVSVAGDTSASYFDTVDDSLSTIVVLGEASMACRWSSSDLAYSAMGNDCSIAGAQATCPVSNVGSQGFVTRYVSCQNSLGLGQTASNNLDVQFYLDYTKPTTSDNSASSVTAPNYVVTITEIDNVDSDPTTLYCTDTAGTCTPSSSIDNGGTVTFTSSNRGLNFLRYYSTDDAGNVQTTQNKSININQLPVLSSASDNAATILGGTTVTVSTNSSDADSGQNMYLYVCSSSGANSSGCTGTQYCSAVGTGNLSCGFASESDSTTHTWFAYIFDAAGEAASANPLTGIYVTDATAPTITVASPSNTTYTQSSVAATMVVNEPLSYGSYSLDGAANVSLSNVSIYEYSVTLTGLSNSLHSIIFYANDTLGNLASSSLVYFTVDTTSPDSTAPTITVVSPINNTYYLVASTLLNITGDESLSWAGYVQDGGALTNLTNTSLIHWNATVSLAEGQHNFTFYANDTASTPNQGSKNITMFVDLNNPAVSSFACTSNPANDSQNVTCTGSFTDSYGLSSAIISYNASGSAVNTSSISVTGTSNSTSFTILSGNTTPGGFVAIVYLYDLAGRLNVSNTTVSVRDDTVPIISAITSVPNTTAALDPNVVVQVNATVTEDFNISRVVLMYQENATGVWNYVTMTNNSNLVVGGNSTVIYNASFTPTNGTWIFAINATDNASNVVVSANTTAVVTLDTSFANSADIPAINSFTYAQLASNNSLGVLYLNNTGDTALVFDVNVSTASLGSRFDINYTSSQNRQYSAASGANLSLNFTVNTTGLTAGLYAYNISINSTAGNVIMQKYVNIQTSNGPYLVVTISNYSSSVTAGQSNVTFAASVSNYGSQDATGVYLNWTLPSDFTIDSGNLSRSLGNLPIGSSGSNSITITVASSPSASSVSVSVNATADSANYSNTSVSVSISNTNATVTTSSSGAAGSGASGGASGGLGGGAASSIALTTNESIEVVRGESQASFEITVSPTQPNTSLANLSLVITGFPSQYLTVTPAYIQRVNYGQTSKFLLSIRAPSYKSYEELQLMAYISGQIVSANGIVTPYSENRSIVLVIQEVSREAAEIALADAQTALNVMQSKNYGSKKASAVFLLAKDKLAQRRNKESLDLAKQVISTSQNAEKAHGLISLIYTVLLDPAKLPAFVSNSLIANETVKETPINELVVSIPLASSRSELGASPFSSTGLAVSPADLSPAKNLIELSIAAFAREDYELAISRAEEARNLLFAETNRNFGLFVYLYWPYLLAAFILLAVVGVVGYQFYQRASINSRIIDLNRREVSLQKLMAELQHDYFEGRESLSQFNIKKAQYQSELAKIAASRVELRNLRLRILSKEETLKALRIESLEVQNEIKKLQRSFYNEKTISSDEYNSNFEAFEKRISEIEDEMASVQLRMKK